jgi:hypothetical protein
MGSTIRVHNTSGGGGGDVDSFNGRTGVVVSENGDYNTGQVPESTDKNYVTDAEGTTINNTSGTNTGDETAVTIKAKYESNPNTNAYTDGEKTKLAGLESSKFLGEFVSLVALQTALPSPSVGSYAYVDTGTGQDVEKYLWDSSDSQYVLQQGSSTAETPATIKAKYESNVNTNAFTDTEKTNLNNQSGTNTGDETAVTIKAKYESNPNTNAFTNAEKTNLNNQSNTNTGDETASTIQTKRPLKTVNGTSLEGTGNVSISGATLTKETSFSSTQINNFNSNTLTDVPNMKITIVTAGNYSFISTINCFNDQNEEVEVTLAITPISSRSITLIDGTTQSLTAGSQFSFVKQLQFDTQRKKQDQTLQRDFIIDGLLVGDEIDVQINTRGDNIDIENRWLTGFTVS